MSTSPVTSSQPNVPSLSHHQSVPDFLRWAILQIQPPRRAQYPTREHPNAPDPNQADIVSLKLSEEDQPYFDGQDELRIDFSGTHPSPPCEEATLESRLGRWLIKKLQAKGKPVPTRPHGQPQAVQNITANLFSAYQVEGGQLHLGGCQLTDYPFLRLSYRAQELTARDKPSTTLETNGHTPIQGEQSLGTDEVCHLYIGPDGSWVPDQMVQELGLHELEPIDELPPRIDQPTLDTLVSVGRRMTAQMSSSRDPAALPIDPIATTLIWTKYAEGHLQFTIGEASTTLTFSDWAKLLKPPPYQCEHSGASTFHLAATDDGRIDAWEKIGPCEISGERILKQELFQCSVTGQHVLERFIEICPVSGKPCLSDKFALCSHCQQRVSLAVLENDRCAACNHLSTISRQDPRLVWLLGEHPGLGRWKHWKFSETGQVYIAQAARLHKRLLVVVDKQTLQVQFLATSNFFSGTWKEVPDSAVSNYLR